MGDKISQLPAATSVDGTEIVPIVQGGATKKVTGLILRNPAGPASGDLTGNYPNPTLAAITTAQTVGSATQVPVVTVDTKGRVTGLTTAANPQGTVTSVVGGTGLTGGTITSTGTLAVSYGTTAGTAAQGNDSRFATIPVASATLPSPDGTAAIGVSTTFARADHVHERQSVALTGDVTGSGVGSISSSLASITTAQSNIGSGTQVPVISVDAKGRVTALSSVAVSAPTDAITALTGDVTAAGPGSATSALATITTAQTNIGSSTTVPIISVDAKGRVTALGSTPISGSAGGTVTSITAGTGLSGGTITDSGTLAVSYGTTAGTAAQGNDSRLSDSRTPTGVAGGDLTGTYPNPTLADVTTAQTAVGNSTTIPVITVNAKGQITALTTAAAAGGVSLATTAPSNLASVAAVGTGTTAARDDHQHAFPTAVEVGAEPTITNLAVNKGGTGQTSYTNGQLLIGNTTGNTLSKATLTAGSNVTITNGPGTITIASTGGGGALVLDYLIVAGGGGGGRESINTGTGGGGGAGGFLTGSLTVNRGVAYTVTIGAGGAIYGTTAAPGGSGGNSVFASLTAIGGGGGGGGTVNPASGLNGGSGGGSGNNVSTFGSGTTGQGNRGGTGGATSPPTGGGGGGGAGAIGGDRITGTGGVGGAGLASSITGTSVTYAGGGGGAGTVTAGPGGAGGGGNGAARNATNAVSGTINTGGGGGGCADGTLNTGTTGGSGIVVIAYSSALTLATATGTFTQTTAGGNYIFTFTGSGTITF